jgi:2-alkenal reductase
MMNKPRTVHRTLNYAAACAIATGLLFDLRDGAAQEPRTPMSRGPLPADEARVVEIFARAAPAVVFIFAPAVARPADQISPDLRGVAGTGVIWDEQGHIVTNAHVVGRIRRVTARFANGDLIPAMLVGTAQDFDLAVLRLERVPDGMQPISIGESEGLRVGQRAFAIGHPLALAPSLSSGVVSGVDRRLPIARGRDIDGVIQTDAAINPGNSGGPLLDSAGRMVGLNTAILSRTGGSEGLGFAIPIDTVNRIVPQLIRTGRVVRPGIGVQVADAEFARRHGVRGIVVIDVERGTPAQQAGLRGFDQTRQRPRDVITHVGETAVESVTEFARVLERVGVGREVELTLQRDGAERRVRVRITDIALQP